MAVGNPFGLPLFTRLGIGAPNAAPPRVPFQGEQFYTSGPEASLTQLNQMTAQQGQGTMARVPGPDPFQGRPVPLLNPGNYLPPGFGPSVVTTGNERVEPFAGNPTGLPDGLPQDLISSYAAMSPEDARRQAQSRLQQRDVKPPAVQKFLQDVASGNYDFNLSRPQTVSGVGFFPLPPPVNNPLNPNRPRPLNIGPLPNPDEGYDMSNPMPLLSIGGISPFGPGAHLLGGGPGQPGGISSVAFPTLAPSNTNTFTGGLFGGNNPMNNNPMNGGGMNSNQPLSQQIPQVVQQAVTPLLQNTASQLNQGIGSMVNQSLIGQGSGGQTTGFGGTPLPSNIGNQLLGGFNPFR